MFNRIKNNIAQKSSFCVVNQHEMNDLRRVGYIANIWQMTWTMDNNNSVPWDINSIFGVDRFRLNANPLTGHVCMLSTDE